MLSVMNRDVWEEDPDKFAFGMCYYNNYVNKYHFYNQRGYILFSEMLKNKGYYHDDFNDFARSLGKDRLLRGCPYWAVTTMEGLQLRIEWLQKLIKELYDDNVE
jgi:hypothetical protein